MLERIKRNGGRMSEESKMEIGQGLPDKTVHMINGTFVLLPFDVVRHIKELEAKLAESEKLRVKIFKANGALAIKIDEMESSERMTIQLHCIEVEGLERRLKVATEALSFVCTYKSPDYYSLSRGSVFDVARKALAEIRKGESDILNEKS